jgi:Tol biopolymer transport system component
MGFSPGDRLEGYEILGRLGQGGMGEVFRARDTRLGREVALKVLPERLQRDEPALARFRREARALAALDHPAIAAIHGLEESDGCLFVVLELVPGETLAERLARGRLEIPTALRLGAQIAEALQAAHDKGVIHRDLKPSNVQVLADDRIKLLDFGLAKSEAPSQTADSIESTSTATRAGTVLGTPAYMSPEQWRGETADRKTDVWSFGCVLFEMLAGRRPFDGRTVSDLGAAVLKEEPDWAALPPATPASIKALLHRCLEKDVHRRMRDASDLRLEIEEALAEGSRSRRAGRPRLVAPLALAGLVLAALALYLLSRGGGGGGRPHPKLEALTFAAGVQEFPAWSPDGGRLAFSGEKGGVRAIFLKVLADGSETRLTSGERDDILPTWSPDGKRILFVRGREAGKRVEPGDVFGLYNDGDVFALDLASGRESLFARDAYNPSFSPDGKLVAVDAAWAEIGSRRIWLLDEKGNNPQQLSTDISDAVWHSRPRFSPDGKTVVFQAQERTQFHLAVVDVASKAAVFHTTGTFADVNPVWSQTGRWIYFTSNRGGGYNLWRTRYERGGTTSSAEQLTTGAGQDVEPAMAPDGQTLAFSILEQHASLWRLPVSPETGDPRGAPEEVVSMTGENSRGAVSPDGRRVAFNSDRAGDMNLWLYDLEGRSARPLTRGQGGDFQPNWSPDGRTLAFFSSRSGSVKIWSVDVESGALHQLTQGTSVDVNPFFSPDGKTIAYQSDEGGRLEVWAMSPDGSGTRQLTSVGVSGHFLRWTGDSSGVIFRCPCGGKPQSMRIAASGGEAVPLATISGGSHMSLSPDGSRIMDVVGHQTLWVSPLEGGAPHKVFAFDEAGVRIDYPVWSPDGRYVTFDRFRPRGGDIWVMKGFE